MPVLRASSSQAWQAQSSISAHEGEIGMPRTKRPAPYDVFIEHFNDACLLLRLAEMLQNEGQGKARAEVREELDSVFQLSQEDRETLDVAASRWAWIVVKGDSPVKPHHLQHATEILTRNAIIVAATAVEVWLEEFACRQVGNILKKAESTPEIRQRLRKVNTDLGEILDIERSYERRVWGYRKILEDYIRSRASTNPGKFTEVLQLVDLWPGSWKAIGDELQRCFGSPSDPSSTATEKWQALLAQWRQDGLHIEYLFEGRATASSTSYDLSKPDEALADLCKWRNWIVHGDYPREPLPSLERVRDLLNIIVLIITNLEKFGIGR
ncbi:hypothetical protein JDY09_06450 [Thermoleophilum album]|uniref:hypothetical protein n=1 Tax=Thermoleophilum album TaxID=29539 RepID=UPI00237D05AB|nr:hypothetical protein [Thermoleophilum album]WDT93029.1 hypothetical protein JDY09_06450 [Thermoleophilum album]